MRLGERRRERLHDALDRDLAEGAPEALGEQRARPSRVPSDEKRDGIETQCTRSAPSASTQSAAVTRRVDPAGDGDDDVAEPVLLDVVAEPERERAAASARARARTARPCRRARRPCSRVRRRARRPRRAGSALARRARARGGGRRAAAARSRAPARRRRRAACSSNPGARATTSPASSSTTECPSKTSSSWPPTRLQNAKNELVSRARVTSISSRSSALPTWNGDADRFTRSCGAREREIGRRRAGLPDVLADREPDETLAEAQEDEVATLREVAVLVEDAVVRQEVLAVDGPHLAVGAHGARVREVAVEPGRADERDDVRRRARRSLGRGARGRGRRPGRSRRSSGGYPVTASSGKTTRSAPAPRASASESRIRSRLPSRSPTTAFSCASASLTASFRLTVTNLSLTSRLGGHGARHSRPALPRAAHVGQRRLRVRSARGVRRRRRGRGHAAAAASARRGRSRCGRDGEPCTLLDGDALVAEARPAPARRSTRRRPSRSRRPKRRATATSERGGPDFRECFVCGDRARATGSGSTSAPSPGASRSTPPPRSRPSPPRARLGRDRLPGRVRRRRGGPRRRRPRPHDRARRRVPGAGRECVVAAWPLGEDGRKLLRGHSALRRATASAARARAPDLDRAAT